MTDKELIKFVTNLDTGAGISPQKLFLRLARYEGMNLKPRNIAELRYVMPTVRALVEGGVLSYEYIAGTGDQPDSGIYRVVGDITPRIVRTTPEGYRVKKLNNAGNGLRALELMAQRPFVLNRQYVTERLVEAETTLRDLPQAWRDGILRGDDYAYEKAKAENTARQCKALLALPDCPVYFDTAADYRGRLYYGGGLCSPHNGHLARLAFKQEDEITLDCRSSFAQMITIITGSKSLGQLCGIDTEKECDLYLQIAKNAHVPDDMAKAHRDAFKKAIMPRAYGAGEARTREVLEGIGLPTNQIDQVMHQLEPFTRLAKKAQAAAAEWANDGDQLAWETPCGNHPKQQYWTTRQCQFCTGDNSQMWYPAAMALTLHTGVVQKSRTEYQSGAVLGATANIVQSLDASLCADVICWFYNDFGYIPFTVHDSFTVKKEHEDALRSIVAQVMEAMYDSEEMQNIREMLRMPHGKLDFCEINPLSIEG